jgi:phage terminase large subunit
MTECTVELPSKLVPVFMGDKRYRGAYGGRGSGKTRSFAKMAAVKALMLSSEGKQGIILCGREFMNSLDESSMAEIKAAILSEAWLAEQFDIGEKYIRTKDRRIEFKFAGLTRNIDSIKSKSRIHILWIDEAEPVSETAWRKITPTVREHGSEIWVTWNPERKNSATHIRFRENYDPETMSIVEMNWMDNPWFPEVLDLERLGDRKSRPEQYDHTWGGDFVTVVEGAYYAKSLIAAKEDNRIGRIAADPLMTKRAIWDIGGTGAKADATSIWIVQYIGHEVRVLDYYEAVGQPLSAHVSWLKENGHGKSLCILPHDGATHDKVHSVSYESALNDAGFETKVIPNQGKGAAMQRVEASRRLFPQMWFDEDKTQAGRDALAWYHEKRDEERKIGLGPNHDWSSHGADAFGLIAIDHATHSTSKPRKSTFKPRSVV